MPLRRILTLSVVALVLLVDPSPPHYVAQAASITAPGLNVKAYKAGDAKATADWPTDPVLCDLVLDGDVEEGDAASLEQKFQTIVDTYPFATGGYTFAFFLCLRSGGGDLHEAVKIAQFVLAPKAPTIETVIEDGQTCASACAVIFLAGTAPDRVSARPRRFLHPRGRLLYHSSSLEVALRKFSDKDLLAFLTEPTTDPRGLKGKIVDLYKDGSRDVQSVIAAFQKNIFRQEDLGDAWVRPSLFLEMFAQDPDEWICIDNVDAVGRWNIQVYGYQPPKPPKQQNFSNLCRNAYRWRSDRFAVDAEADFEEQGDLKQPPPTMTLAGRNKSNIEFDERFTMSFGAMYLPLICVIEVNYGYEPQSYTEKYAFQGRPPVARRKAQLDAKSTLSSFFLPSGGFTPGSGSVAISALAPTAFSPPATLLRDLPGIRPAPNRDVSQNQPAVSFNDYPNSVMNGCSYKSIPKIERSACQAACAADSACQGYSHNKLTHACELKHTLTARRLDPLWTSGAPSAGPAPGRSVRADEMVRLNDPIRGVIVEKIPRIEGKLIDEPKVERGEECWDRCKSDPMCLAAEGYEYVGEVCRRFSEVTGLREEPASGGGEPLIIKIKKQQ
jgi:hypothetical protein